MVEITGNQFFVNYWHHSYFFLKYLDYALNAPTAQKDQNCYEVTAILWLLYCLLSLHEELQVKFKAASILGKENFFLLVYCHLLNAYRNIQVFQDSVKYPEAATGNVL